jgi:hypothetical protein
VSSNSSKIANVAANISKVDNILSSMSDIQDINANILDVNRVSSNMQSVKNVGVNINKVISVADELIPNLAKVLQVDTDTAQVASNTATVQNIKNYVEATFTEFDKMYLGAKTVDPTTDNKGFPLVNGAMYFNSISNALKVYDDSRVIWVSVPQVYLSGMLDVTLMSITTGDMLVWNGTKWINSPMGVYTDFETAFNNALN